MRRLGYSQVIFSSLVLVRSQHNEPFNNAEMGERIPFEDVHAMHSGPQRLISGEN